MPRRCHAAVTLLPRRCIAATTDISWRTQPLKNNALAAKDAARERRGGGAGEEELGGEDDFEDEDGEDDEISSDEEEEEEDGMDMVDLIDHLRDTAQASVRSLPRHRHVTAMSWI